MSDRLLILNATAVNEGRVFETDLLAADGRIAVLGPDLSGRPADTVIDAAGLHLLPGMIDDQVHFREPGPAHIGNFRAESAAAVAGGTTSVMDMPNNRPPVTDRDALAAKFARAESVMHTNYSFYLGATNANAAETARAHETPACGLKIFMGASTGDMLVDDPDALAAHFAGCRLLIATHCEDTPTIEANIAAYEARHGPDIPLEYHPLIRSREACLKSSTLAIELARAHGARLHVLHLTTADELALFAPGPCADKRITAEVCIHHLVFCDEDYAGYGARIKCNPAIKTAADRAALRAALREDRIDVIATDHAPHLLADKRKAVYREAPAGLPYIQHALTALLELVHQGELALEDAVRKIAHAPAECYRLADRGFLREGYWADLTLVDLAAEQTLSEDGVLHQCGWSAFDGRAAHARVDTTVVSGRIACRDGKVREAAGRPLEFAGR